jgi:hypothetical protein
MIRRLAPLAAFAVALACAPRLIPGTDIEDTAKNRGVYDAIEAYRVAMEKRDAGAVLALVAPDYFDDAGTPDPSDDMDRARLEQALPADLAKLDSLKLSLTVRKIEVKDDTALADVLYDSYYRVVTPAGPVPKRESDVHRMRFRKVDGAWKITSGL